MTKINPTDVRWVFFGTPDLAVNVLNELEEAGLIPTVVVTAPDRPRGRGMHMQPTPVKQWAEEHSIDVLTPEKVTPEFIAELANTEWDVFVVMAYGLILPQALLDIPHHGTVNLHPSLLPKLRGASPIRSAILTDIPEAVGISIMLMDAKMDHGPIIAQASVEPEEWPAHGLLMDQLLTHEGGKFLAEVLPAWLSGEITPQEQDHAAATFAKKFTKEDMEIDLSADAYHNLLKIRAFEGMPNAHTFVEHDGKRIRVQIVDAHIENGKLILDTVKPEGKGEMSYTEFMQSIN